MEAVKSPGDIISDNFGAGGIKSHSKTPLIQLCTFPKRGMSKIPGADSAGGFFPNAPGRRGFGWGGVGVKAINLFKIGARRGLDVTAGAVAPILKRLIAVNTFVSPWGPKIIG